MKKILLLMAIVLPFVLISCGDDKDEPENPDNHEWVDLGLPSGTLWATCNVGANAPEEYGDYFAWGETEPKEVYTWETYKWCNGNKDTLTKYCGSDGSVDNKTELDPEDDAAYVNWGPSWRMPTKEHQQELIDNCTWVWTTCNGVNGQLVTGPNGNTMFLPAAGFCWDVSHYYGLDVIIWSRSLNLYSPDIAYDLLSSDSDSWSYSCDDRAIGFTVRAVRVTQN